MTSIEFYKAVKEMRRLQKAYSRSRKYDDLEASKKQERMIDAEIMRVETITANMNKETDGKLF